MLIDRSLDVFFNYIKGEIMKFVLFVLACSLGASAFASPTTLQITCKSKNKVTARGYAIIQQSLKGPFTKDPGQKAVVAIAVGGYDVTTFEASYLPSNSADKLF